MTAAATKVKEITLTFSKAVADTAAAKITVKKGNATPTYASAKWADDAKSVVLAMDSKLTAGTYDVTVSGIETADLTASIAVENQKLTEFVLASDYLIADHDSAANASIAFKAVDQYGERVNGVKATVSITLGTLANAAEDSSYTTTATGDTKVKVKDIPPVLAIAGQTGKITIVDTQTGVNLVKDITYQPASKAVKVETVGLYDAKNKKVETLTAGADVAGYKVAFKFTDQYDMAVGANDDTLKDIQFTVIGGTTNVTGGALHRNFDIGGTKYAVCELKGSKFAAGTFQISTVNVKHGLLGTSSFDVAPGTVIKSFSVSVDNDVYEGESVNLSYTAIDADGKEVTSYDLLKKALDGGLPTFVSLNKQKDGTAKLSYKYTKAVSETAGGTNSITDVLTFQLYKGSVNTLVVNTTVRVNQKRVFWEVVGVDTAKTVAGSEKTLLSFKAEDLKIIDQYGNTLTKANINSLIGSDNKVSVTQTVTDAAWTIVTGGALDASGDEFGAVVGTSGSIKFKLQSVVNKKDAGYELTLSYKDPQKASDFVIEWKNGNTFNVSSDSKTLGERDFKVCGTVDGKKVEIPDTQYRVLDGNTINKIDRENGKNIVTKEGTLKVVVTDADNKATTITAPYTYSNAYETVSKISAKSDKKTVTCSAFGADTLVKIDLNKIIAAAFEIKDQYGEKIESGFPKGLVADVVVTGTGKITNDKGELVEVDNEATINFNGTNSVEVTAKKDKPLTEITVTLTFGDLSATTTVEVDVQ